jgi:hypothetical protein
MTMSDKKTQTPTISWDDIKKKDGLVAGIVNELSGSERAYLEHVATSLIDKFNSFIPELVSLHDDKEKSKRLLELLGKKTNE